MGWQRADPYAAVTSAAPSSPLTRGDRVWRQLKCRQAVNEPRRLVTGCALGIGQQQAIQFQPVRRPSILRGTLSDAGAHNQVAVEANKDTPRDQGGNPAATDTELRRQVTED
jgi:hypothetical protein